MSDEKLGVSNFLELTGIRNVPLWQEWDLSLWGAKSDPPMQSDLCFAVYHVNYVISWIACAMLVAYFVVNMNAGKHASETYVLYLATGALVSSLLFAVIALGCSVSVRGTQYPCMYRSRQAFNFVWPGVILMLYAYLTSVSRQKENKQLEKYLVQLQYQKKLAALHHATDEKKRRKEQSVNSNLEQEVEDDEEDKDLQDQSLEVLRAKRMLQFIKETDGASSSEDQVSVVLSPIHSFGITQSEKFQTFLFVIGAVYVGSVVLWMFSACSVDFEN
jgi:hypothetical protein